MFHRFLFHFVRHTQLNWNNTNGIHSPNSAICVGRSCHSGSGSFNHTSILISIIHSCTTNASNTKKQQQYTAVTADRFNEPTIWTTVVIQCKWHAFKYHLNSICSSITLIPSKYHFNWRYTKIWICPWIFCVQNPICNYSIPSSIHFFPRIFQTHNGFRCTKINFFYQISTEIFRWRIFFDDVFFSNQSVSTKNHFFTKFGIFHFFALVSTKNEWMVFDETIFGLYAVPIKHMCHV